MRLRPDVRTVLEVSSEQLIAASTTTADQVLAEVTLRPVAMLLRRAAAELDQAAAVRRRQLDELLALAGTLPRRAPDHLPPGLAEHVATARALDQDAGALALDAAVDQLHRDLIALQDAAGSDLDPDLAEEVWALQRAHTQPPVTTLYTQTSGDPA